MRLLDRYIIRNFLLNYLLAFAVLVGMYTLLDLIINFDRFTKFAPPGAGSVASFFNLLGDITDYYAYRMLVIFQQISAAIPLLAAGFTMVRMTRHNELTAMLASGVSLYRVALPIIFCALFFSGLVVIDQEILMPRFVDKLLRQHDEVSHVPTRDDPLYFVRNDDDNSLLTASRYDPAARRMQDVRIIQRDKNGTPIRRIMASEAVWDPKAEVAPGAGIYGLWILKNARMVDDTGGDDPTRRVAEKIDFMPYRTRLTPEQLDLVFTKKAVDYLSSAQVQTLIQDSPEVTKTSLEKMMHIRFTQPIMNVILLMMGLPFLLTREPRQLIKNMIYCTAVTAFCFVATFVMFQAAGQALPPLLGAWLPVLLFGPLAVAMLDTIKT